MWANTPPRVRIPLFPPEKALLLKCFFVSRKELIFMKNQKLKGCAAALLANIIFGFSFLFSKVSLSYAEPLTIAAVRFTLAFAVLSILWAFGAIKMNFKGKKKKKIILMALAQPLFYFVFELYGIANTSSAISGVIISLVPVAVIVLSTLFLKERPTIRQVLFSALSLASVIFISILSNDNKLSTPLGIAFLSGAVLSAAVFNILSRSEAATYSPTERTYIMFLIGAAGFNAIAFCVHGTSFFTSAVSALAQPLFLISVIYLSIVSSIAAFLLYNYATSLITSVQAASFSNIITVVSVLAGIFIMGESLSPVQIICSLLIIIGVLGVNK